VRTDGLWDTIAGPRLFAWYPGGRFADKAMGSGSEPGYVGRGNYVRAEGLWLLHYGYARVDDQKAKYARYSGLAAHGHADAHVQSIVARSVLRDWEGPFPNLQPGVRRWTRLNA
jgi:hypothetical protein